MKEAVRTGLAGAVGAVVAVALVVGSPALAGQVGKIAPKNSVTSKSIKNGTIKPKDLNAAIRASLAKANTALQKVPANSVTGTEVKNGSLTAGDIAVSSGAVTIDFGNLPTAGACAPSSAIETGRTVTGDFILVREPLDSAGNIQFYGREDPLSTTAIDVVACNNGNSDFNPPSASFTWAVIAH
jgi:hypothetical protein